MERLLSNPKMGGMLLLCVLLVFMQSSPAAADLVHLWTLDEPAVADGSTITDSVGGLNGTAMSDGVTSQPGMVGGAIHFAGNGIDGAAGDNDGDHINVLNFNTTNLKNVTLTFWMNMDEGTIASLANGDHQRIISADDGWEAMIQADGSPDTGKMGNNLFRTSGKDLYVLTQDVMPEGVWVHVAMTASLSTAPGGTGLMEIYLDGELDNSRPDGALIDWTSGTLMFAHRPGRPADNHYSGLLDDIRIYDEILSADDIKALYESAFAGPVAIYPGPDENVPASDLFLWTFAGDVEVVKYYMYLDTDQGLIAELDALLADQYDIFAREVLPVSSTDPNASDTVNGILEDTVYYWRVDADILEPNGVNPGVYDVAGFVEGPVWSFAGLSSVPAITLQPVDLTVLPDPITHTLGDATATFTVEFKASQPLLSIVWMKDGSPLTIDGTKYVQADDTANLADASTSLTINSVGAADAGAYSVIITLDTDGEGSDTSVEATLTVVLDTDILAHRWSFNGTDASALVDLVNPGDGTLAAEIVDPDDQNIFLLGNEVQFGGDLRVGDNSGSADPNAHFIDLRNNIISELGNNMTLMVWFTWESASDWQRVYDFGISAGGEGVSQPSPNEDYIELTPRAGGSGSPMRLEAHMHPNVNLNHTSTAPLDQEICVAISWDSANDEFRMYVDGEYIATQTLPAGKSLSSLNDLNCWLGRSSYGNDLFRGKFNEFRIYSIPMNDAWAQALYEAGPDGEAVNVDPCVAPLDSKFDTNNDCVVGMADLLDFLTRPDNGWLSCGLLSCP